MQSSSAAAIAAQRSKELYGHNDRASLLNSDSVVVYNERTALWETGCQFKHAICI